jgi:cell division protein FtsW
MPYDRLLILSVLTLSAVGLVIVFSASSVISLELYGSSTTIFIKQLYAVLLGLGFMLLAMRLDYRLYQNRYILAALVAAAIGMLCWALISPDVNGVHRWVRIGPMRFQPSEIAKLGIIFVTAYYLVKIGGQIRSLEKQMLWYFAPLGLLMLLVLLEPDFGTTTSLAFTLALLFFVAGLPWRYYLGALLLAAPGLYFLVYRVPYRWNRLLAFWDPEADPYGAGYQILQSLIAVGSGGLGGKGLAQSTQKLFFLPEAQTDFIFAVLAEEMGIWGSTLVLLLFMIVLWRGVRISLKADTLFGTYVGLGIVCMIVFQALFNISVVLSLCPTKGIPLPFISAGGSSVLVMLIAVGILLNISRNPAVQVPEVIDDRPPAKGTGN